mmetsp:Transcript_36682/g.82183  ORF Transcript_36682/g.82183 Transcript_36682/m.82183 type:complete len:435 (+) Transcript_36682:632-1936(+)
MRLLSPCRLPSVKGSRQNLTVQQATRVLRNAPTYLQYMHETRIESNPNKLVEGVWGGLRGRYVLGAFRTRSFVDVAFTTPLIFFTHSDHVTRPMPGRVMGAARAWVVEVQGLDYIGSKAAPDLQFVVKWVLAEILELQAGYDSWWKTTGPDLTSAYATATEKSFWPLASAHLVAAAPFMLAIHDRHLDDDCQGIPVLKHAAKTTDAVESQFATYDYAMQLGAGFGATAGVAQATRMHAMKTPGAMRDKAKAVTKAKRKHDGGSEASQAGQVDDLVAKWDVTNFFALPADQRWTIIRSVRKGYNDNAIAERLLLQRTDEAKAARIDAARQAKISKYANRSLKYEEFAALTPISSTAALEALAAQHAESPAVLAEALRQQMRVRLNVHGIEAPALPYIGAKPGASEEDEAARLRTAFAGLVQSALPARPGAPAPCP